MNFKEYPHRLFLIDGIGALGSALFLGIVLVKYNSHIGMPVSILYMLAALAVGFSVYSLICYGKRVKNWKLWLRRIAVINLCYCGLTLLLVLYNWDTITFIGIGYFILEIIIIIGLAGLEWRNASENFY